MTSCREYRCCYHPSSRPHLIIIQRLYCLSMLHSLYLHKDCHPYLPTFLSILEMDNSDQIEKRFLAVLIFSPVSAQDLLRRRPVDVINELSRSSISYSRSDLDRLKQRCEQEIASPVFPTSLLTTIHPLFSQSTFDGKERVLRDLLLPTASKPISSCGIQIASLTSFPMDSPRNCSLADLLANTDPSATSAPLAPLSELFDDINELGSVEMRVLPPISFSITHTPSRNFSDLPRHCFQ